MQSNKEALFAAYRGEMPEFIPPLTECTAGAVFPGDRYFGPETEGEDAWGVRWTNLGPDPGLDGSTVTPGYQRLSSISAWKEEVSFPDLDALHAKEILIQMMQSNPNPEACVTHVLFLSGPWERMNQLLGMEEALCSFYEDPESVHEFLDAMCEYKIKCIDIACEAVNPHIIHMHDDWGSSSNLMFSPQMWREFIKPIEQRLCSHIHSKGKLYEHHSCGYVTTIVPDLAEIGVDALNPLNVCNDMAYIKKHFGHKLTLAGGIDNQKIDREDISEDEIRAEVRRAMDAYAPGGRYIPQAIFTSRRVRDIFMDEVKKYGKGIYQQYYQSIIHSMRMPQV